jgi:hypothetical protein
MIVSSRNLELVSAPDNLASCLSTFAVCVKLRARKSNFVDPMFKRRYGRNMLLNFRSYFQARDQRLTSMTLASLADSKSEVALAGEFVRLGEEVPAVLDPGSHLPVWMAGWRILKDTTRQLEAIARASEP